MANIEWSIDNSERQDFTLQSIRTDGEGQDDPRYLRESVGKALRLGLADLVKKQPYDPIEHLAHFLYKHRENMILNEKDEEQNKELAIQTVYEAERMAVQHLLDEERMQLEEEERQKEAARLKRLEEELEKSLIEEQRRIDEQKQLVSAQIQALKDEALRKDDVKFFEEHVNMEPDRPEEIGEESLQELLEPPVISENEEM